jgi:hypothetical protein
MYIDDILKYRRICIASTDIYENVSNKILNDVSNYIGNECTIINEYDDFDKSKLNCNFVVSYYPFDKIRHKSGRLFDRYDNFIIFKTHLFINITNTKYIIPNRLLYETDLVLYIYNNFIEVVKDRYLYFLNKDKYQLYKNILLDNRIYKINKILKRKYEDNRNLW